MQENLFGDDVDGRLFGALAVKAHFAHGTEVYDALCQGKQRVVFAQAYIGPGEHFGAALAYDNVARLGCLARIELNPKVFWLGVGKVFS